jgi:hypothetical protein
MQWIRRNLKVIVPVGAVLAIGVAFLAFGVFGVQTLFFDETVDEAGPVFDSGVGVNEESSPDTALDEAPAATVVKTPEVSIADTPVETVPPSTEPSASQVVTLAAGSFISRAHPGEGTALVLNDGSEQRFLRFENFSTDNGPDLNVYLTTSDANADPGTFDDEFIDLGNLKGNIGEQNYEIPPDVDLSRFDTVVVWCVRFSSAFTAADLTAPA